jgi:hypothetical protein
MQSRRFACFIVGMWLAGGLFWFWVGRVSAHSAELSLSEQNPGVELRVKPLGVKEARLLLHHAAAEEFRSETELWETGQVVLGILFFLYLLFGTREGKLPLVLALMALALVAAQKFALTPNVLSLGRLTDFGTDAADAAYRIRLHVLTAAHAGFEFVKWGCEIAIGVLLIGHRRRQSGNSRQDFYTVDETDHGHIYR